MTKSRTWLILGAAALALAGTTAVASAQAVHEFAVQLPGGGVEHIRYTGDAKPVVVMLPANPFAAAFAPPFWPSQAFAEMNQISAQMDRQMNAMLTQAGEMQAAAQSGVLNASFGNLPRGAVEYTQISTWNGNGMCTRTVRMTEPEGGGKLQTVSSTSGDCTGNAPAAHAAASGLIQAKATATPRHAQATRT
ncbi:MAG TPA: hypothetical protein VMD53_05660 [Rhizomicrobium sp.]|nr:hypothetical protein [Rhizomicrobium sp.]